MTNSKYFRWLKRLLFCGILGAAGYAGWHWSQLPQEGPQFQTAKVTRGDLAQAVTASGQLNPVVKVQVGSQISGIIQKLSADFNSPVKAGQVLAQLDPSTYQAMVHQAEGSLASARASMELARLSYQRSQSLQKNELVSQSEHDKALADLHQAEAAVKINEANLEKVQVDLARCTIYSPIDGIVISRNVDVGQTVAASLSAPTLFFIANDLARMQIEAHVAEADIGRVEVGQDVSFTVDAFADRTFQGKVAQIRNAPTNEQYVVTYETIIEVSNRDAKLKPGMTANVSIVVARRDNVLKVPNTALRFRPPKSVEVVKTLAGRNADANKPDVADAPSTGDPAAAGEKKSDSAKKPDGGKSKKEKKKAERTVYVLRDGGLQAVKLKLGIADGRDTELLDGLSEGDAVVVDMTEPKESTPMLSRLFAAIKR